MVIPNSFGRHNTSFKRIVRDNREETGNVLSAEGNFDTCISRLLSISMDIWKIVPRLQRAYVLLMVKRLVI